ncbi:MAG: hypothetical protein ACRDGH_11030, partial [Candidatus Limnocylindria bacterium]
MQDRDSSLRLRLGRLHIAGLARGFGFLDQRRRLGHVARTSGPGASQRPRSLSILATRGLSILATRSLSILTTRGLSILTTRSLSILTTRSLSILTTRGLSILTTRSLSV